MSGGRKYMIRRNNVELARAVQDAMKARQFDHERPEFRDEREARWYRRIVKGAGYVADMEAGSKISVAQRAFLERMNVLVEDGRVRRWGYLVAPWLVRAYGHAVNLRAGDVDDPRHPEYVRPTPEA